MSNALPESNIDQPVSRVIPGIWGCVWRGALSGMIGPLGFILFMGARRPNDALAIAYLPIILPITATVGQSLA